jgi:transcriptional regulator with XRE-family HTH domain
MSSRIPQQFGQLIRRRREQAGITQEALGHKAGLSRNYVGMLERGERVPTIITVRQLAVALGTTAATLMQELDEALGSQDDALDQAKEEAESE